jgi:lipoprotein NlpD
MPSGCATGPAYTPQTYIVQPRDTLYSIAWRHDLDYRDLARWNHIGADYRIAVGQVLMLTPANNGASQGAERNSSPPPQSASSGISSSGAGVAGAGAPKVAAPSSRAPNPALPGTAGLGLPCGSAPSTIARSSDVSEPPGAQHWMWPTAHASAPRPVPGGGILLLGELGQSIRAACGGRVVYAGSGIRGYGNLIIIKHADTVLSAYAHTVEPRVHEGEEVSAGEQIARMGSGPHDIAALYFEIRLNGKPVDPLPFLPAGD